MSGRDQLLSSLILMNCCQLAHNLGGKQFCPFILIREIMHISNLYFDHSQTFDIFNLSNDAVERKAFNMINV